MNSMQRNSLRVITFVSPLLLASAAVAGKGKGGGGGKSEDTPVCVGFELYGDLGSDIAGVDYCDAAFAGGDEGMVSHLFSSGRFAADTFNASYRRIIVNYPGCETLIDPDPSSNDCLTDAGLRTGSEWADDDAGLAPIYNIFDLNSLATGGESAYVDFQIAFPSNFGKTPHLVIFGGSNLGDNSCGDPLTVTRIADSEWTIAADNTAGCLFEVQGKNSKRTMSDPFPMSFVITVHQP